MPDRDSAVPDVTWKAVARATYDQAVQIMENPPLLGTMRDLFDHRLGTYGQAYETEGYVEVYKENERLQAEIERLKGRQRWRACGGDKGAPPDCDPWRDDIEAARSDEQIMKTTTKPPYEHVWVETCWMSDPERCEPAAASDDSDAPKETA